METLIGIIAIVAGIGYVVYSFKKADAKVLDVSFTQTTPLKDAVEIFDEMGQTDPSYRHYVEIKGTVHGDEVLTAPFSNREAIYYSNTCYSVTQESHVTTDSNGNKRTRTVKKEQELASETSSESIYVTDNSCDQKIYVDIQSFEKNVDLTKGCDKFEQKNSQWSTRYGSGFHRGAGSNFLGFRLKESILMNAQPLYILGELYKMGDKMYLGKAQMGNKTSFLSIKSEEQIVNDTKAEKMRALFAGGAAVLVALFFLFS